MDRKSKAKLAALLLELVPPDGATIGNQRLRQELSARLGREVSEDEYDGLKTFLLERGDLLKGQGRGGSVRRAEANDRANAHVSAATLVSPERPAFELAQTRVEDSAPAERRPAKSKPGVRRVAAEMPQVISYRHAETRRNNPEVGMVDPDSDPDEGKTPYAYDPHLDPALQFDVGRAEVERIIDDALASGDDTTMHEALITLKRMAEPHLAWAGKAERTSFETPLPYREAIEFYKHDRGWSNRLIAGDSLLVMNSLLQKEGMAGQVQMVYIDQPYGIKYGSNFQPFVKPVSAQ